MCALVTGVQTCALPISVDEVVGYAAEADPVRLRAVGDGTAPVDQDQRPVVAKRAQLDRGKPLALRVAAVAGRRVRLRDERQLRDQIGRASCRERVCQYV